MKLMSFSDLGASWPFYEKVLTNIVHNGMIPEGYVYTIGWSEGRLCGIIDGLTPDCSPDPDGIESVSDITWLPSTVRSTCTELSTSGCGSSVSLESIIRRD